MNLKRLFVVAGLLLLQLIVFPVERVSSQGLSLDGVRVISLADVGKDRANAIAFSPDGRRIAVAASAGIYLFDSQTLSMEQFIHTDTWVRALAISPDGASLVAGLFDETARLFSFPDFQPRRQLENLGGWVRSVAFTPDGRRVAIAAGDAVRLWNATDGSLYVTIKDMVGVRALAMSPDGIILAVGLQDNSIQLRNTSDGSLMKVLLGHEGWIRCLTFSPDGTQLASGAFDATARLWDVQNGTLQHTLTDHQSSVLGIAFSPDGSKLATGSVDQTVRLWNSGDGSLLHTFVGHTSFVYTVAFSPDGQTLASGANDNTVRLWDLAVPEDTSVQPPVTPTDCRICHHPANNTSPVAVVDVRCDACHPDGLGVNWCPFFPRFSDETEKMEIHTASHEQAGLPVPSRSLAITIFSPANGEVVYSNASYVAPLQVTGKVASLNLPLEQVAVHLEVWDGAQMVSSLPGVVQPNGHFVFNLGVNPEGHMLRINDPAAPFNCAYCHDDYFVQARVPAGELDLRVVASSPNGDKASDERRITTDVNDTLPLEVHVIDAISGNPVDDLTIHGSTRLYEWRDRTNTAATGENGLALLHIEVLSQAPTTYEIQIHDQVVDGVFYSTAETAELTVQPGTTSLMPLTLKVNSERGQIRGILNSNPTLPLTIWAIQLPGGPILQAKAGLDGHFSFKDIPVARYSVVADRGMLADQQLSGKQTIIDLTRLPSASMSLDLSTIAESYNGTVVGQHNEWLPFTWLLASDGTVLPNDIRSGLWMVGNDTPIETRIWVAVAPGYYSQEIRSFNKMTAVTLKPRPDLEQVTWGLGNIMIPSETQAQATPGTIDFESGWVWGTNTGDAPVVIHAEEAEIRLASGQFALERSPGGIAWFYLFAGRAEVKTSETNDILSVLPGQMIALSKSGSFAAFPYESVVASALHTSIVAPISNVWEPGLAEKLRASTQRIGVIFAQFVTFITYFVAVISLVAIPWLTVRWLYKHYSTSGERNDRN